MLAFLAADGQAVLGPGSRWTLGAIRVCLSFGIPLLIQRRALIFLELPIYRILTLLIL